MPAAPVAPAAATAAPAGPPVLNHPPREITKEAIAATALTADERAQQQRDTQQAEQQGNAAFARVNGDGSMQVADAPELPIVIGLATERTALQPDVAQTNAAFLSAITPPAKAQEQAEAPPEHDAAGKQMLSEAGAGGASMLNDSFDHLGDVEQSGFQQGRPEGMFAGMKPANKRTPDRAQVLDEVNPVAAVFGARLTAYNKSYDWCRNAEGVRHSFTYDFFELGVLVDVYSPDQYRNTPDAIKAEVAEKAAIIERRNDAAGTHIGYFPVVQGYIAKPAEIEDVKSGLVCTELRVGPLPAPKVDRYDSARAASGDMFSDHARRGEQFTAENWNKPIGWAAMAR